jgi:hypothetical protein
MMQTPPKESNSAKGLSLGMVIIASEIALTLILLFLVLKD